MIDWDGNIHRHDEKDKKKWIYKKNQTITFQHEPSKKLKKSKAKETKKKLRQNEAKKMAK